MKKYFAALSATALISVAPYALAASSTDLTVTGTITPSACTPSFPNGGTVEYGKINVADLNQTSVTALPRHTQSLNIACQEPTTFALYMTDNRPGTSNTIYFGMGLTPQNEKLGYFAPYLFNVLADGATVRPIESTNKQNWKTTTNIAPNWYLAVSSMTDTTPIVAKDVSMDLEVRGFISRADSLTLTDDVAIDGSATFEVHYL